ncbi:sugar transferase [Patescibacteria group bacterium]|nr:sugar transferase [Patescibacteria group bacterium]MBU1703201.1 sugar transferase [Patescibacteria group bacterium]
MIENALLKANIGKRNLLFIGNNVVTETLYERMKKDPKYRIVGLLGMHTNGSIRNLGSIDNLADIVKKYKVEEILQTTSGLSKTQAEDILEFCRENHLAYSFVPDLLAMHKTNVEIRTQSGIPIIKMKPTPLDGWGRVIKRGFDTLGALVGLILLSPIFLLTAIAIKLDSKGNIFFKYLDDGSRVKRVGQHGKLFNFYKFRTMHPGTHNLRYTRLAEKNARKGSPLVKIKDDPRITRTGRFLRKTSIDELPQLVNVLKGEMSLVGPRPHLPEEVAKYAVHHKFVLTIKPGITGLAQISGRSDLDFEEEMRLDTYYIENWSLWMDIVILFKTFGVFFKGYRE